MIDPLFWLGFSMFLVAISLTAVLVAALPALHELARAARSAEKLFDTLRREFPPTLEAIRLTGLEISDLTDDISEGVNNASNVVKQVDETLNSARQQAKSLKRGTRGVVAGVKAALKTWNNTSVPPRRSQKNIPSSQSPSSSLKLPSSDPNDLSSEENYPS